VRKATAGNQDAEEKSLRRFAYIRRLWPLRALHNFKFNRVALLQTLVTLAGDRAVMHEYVGPILASDKPVSFGVIEPFHCTFQTIHLRTSEVSGLDTVFFLPLCVR